MKVVSLSMRMLLQYISEGVVKAGLEAESPRTGPRRPESHPLRHSAARHWLIVGKKPLNVVSLWLGHANVGVTLLIYLPIVCAGPEYNMEDTP